MISCNYLVSFIFTADYSPSQLKYIHQQVPGNPFPPGHSHYNFHAQSVVFFHFQAPLPDLIVHQRLFHQFFQHLLKVSVCHLMTLRRTLGERNRMHTCARSFYVGDAVKKEDIHAKFEDGILHITLPAPQQQKALPVNPNLIEIE